MSTTNNNGEIVSGTLVKMLDGSQIYEVGEVSATKVTLYLNGEKVAKIGKDEVVAV